MPRTLVKDAERMLGNVPEAHAFRCQDGSVFRNMKDLRDALARMKDDTFAHHSSAEKKDFAKWVREVIGDNKLATELEKSPDRRNAAKKVSDRVAFLTGKLL
jgi:hypothetical protein